LTAFRAGLLVVRGSSPEICDAEKVALRCSQWDGTKFMCAILHDQEHEFVLEIIHVPFPHGNKAQNPENPVERFRFRNWRYRKSGTATPKRTLNIESSYKS
jgi:hypothetical protein